MSADRAVSDPPLPSPSLNLVSAVEIVEWLVASHCRAAVLANAAARGYAGEVSLTGRRPTVDEVTAVLASGSDGRVDRDKQGRLRQRWYGLRGAGGHRRALPEGLVGDAVHALGLGDVWATELQRLANEWCAAGQDPKVRRYDAVAVENAISITREVLDGDGEASGAEVLDLVSRALADRGDAWTTEDARLWQLPQVRRRQHRGLRDRTSGAAQELASEAAEPTVRADRAASRATAPAIVRWDPRNPPGRLVLIEADGGLGKTWLLRRHFDELLADARLSGAEHSNRGAVPLLLRAAVLAEAVSATTAPGAPVEIGPTLAAALLGSSPDNGTRAKVAKAIDRASNEGRLVVGVDGWEGISGPAQDHVLAAIGVLSRSSASLLVAVRPSARELVREVLAAEHVIAELQPFGDSEISSYITAFFADGNQAQSVRDLIRSERGVASLVTTPLLLGYLCRIAHRGSSSALTRPTLLRETLLELLSTPDPDAAVERLRVLGRAAASLASPWRAGLGAVERAQLEAALQRELGDDDPQSAHADDRLEKGRGCETAASFLDGLIRDRVLIEERAGGEAVIRFPHQLLHATAVASALAELDPEACWALLEPHRWFDADWDDVFLLCGGLMADPSDLIERLLSEDHDAWLVQLGRAGGIVAERHGDVSSDVVAEVMDRLAVGARFQHSEFRRAPTTALALLIEVDVDSAKAASAALLEDSTVADDVGLALAYALAATGDERGTTALMEYAAGMRTTSARSQGEAVVGLSSLGRPWISILEQRLTARHAGTRLILRSAAAFETAGQEGSSQLARLLSEARVGLDVRAQLATTLAIGPARDLMAAAVSDRRVPWSVRAAASVALLRSGQPPGRAAREIADSPNLVDGRKAQLLAALISAGHVSEDVAEEATGLLFRYALEPSTLRDLAHAVASTDHGRRQAHPHLEWLPRSRPVTFLALVRSGDSLAADRAAEVITDEAAPAGLRRECAVALSTVGYPNSAELVAQLLGETTMSIEERARLAAATSASPTSAAELSTYLLADAVGDEALLELARAMYGRHQTAVEVLDGILCDPNVSLARRVQVGVASCLVVRRSPAWQLPVALSALLEETRQEQYDFVRLGLCMAMAGSPSEAALEVLLTYVNRSQGPHRLLRSILTDGGVTQDFVQKALVSTGKAARGKSLRAQSESLYKALEREVGLAIARLMTLEDLDEFEAFIDDNDQDGALRWLEENVPFYPLLVQKKHQELTSSPALYAPRTPNENANSVPQEMDDASFAKWCDSASVGAYDVEASLRFLVDSPPTRAFAATLLSRGAELSWPCEAGHRLLVVQTARHGLGAAARLLNDVRSLRTLVRYRLETADGLHLMDAAAVEALRWGPSPPPYFYGSLGAALAGMQTEAITLMERCRDRLRAIDEPEDMIRQGVRTIGEVETLHGLDDRQLMSVLQDLLLDALPTGHGAPEASSPPDEAPGST